MRRPPAFGSYTGWMASVFITGGTGYVGSALILQLLGRGHRVRALARPGSALKAAPGCERITGDALDGASYRSRIGEADTFVHLVGVAHPESGKGGGVPDRGPGIDPRAVAAARFAGIDTFRSRERGAPGADDEGLHRGTSGGRGDDPRGRTERDDRAAVVRAGPRAPLADGASAGLLADGEAAGDAGPARSGWDWCRSGRWPARSPAHAVENPAHGVRVLEVPDIRRARRSLDASAHQAQIAQPGGEAPLAIDGSMSCPRLKGN